MAEMREALSALRNEMQANGIDAWIVPTTDFHGSEYVNDYFKCRGVPFWLHRVRGNFGSHAVTRRRCGRTADIFCRQRPSLRAAALR